MTTPGGSGRLPLKDYDRELVVRLPDKIVATCEIHGECEFQRFEMCDGWMCGHFFDNLPDSERGTCGRLIRYEDVTPDGGPVAYLAPFSSATADVLVWRFQS